mmetsp:Transcript_53301/g.62239  ORF Transcript_53301/g.62239 Transcript_53301/m.62239 type:complete len:637 (-) Transcript_53301:304-2214(-)|eukprot:CAMPEP_0194374112 /NCGR_PEP_ID=MMETSP0174-20130528/22481_1 /TAXON_ID=216777 /ORGANISM="Proboscia alata, Strain PI-D3" /LENGTH=636 /DNA_ID=CAMNT_0039153467 /DNA_START=214 /DNA_END=2124 /DNA_ORIENTATION=+
MASILSQQPQDAYVQYIPITAVKVYDVLCGRGGTINTHPGNESFRVLVNSKKRVYLTSRFKREKRIIAQSIVDQIRTTGGRFLCRKEVPRRGRKKNVEEEMWFAISDEKARYKTSQALRENAPKIRKEIETEQKVEGSKQETVGDDDDYEERVINDHDEEKKPAQIAKNPPSDSKNPSDNLSVTGSSSWWDELPSGSRSFSTIIQNQWNSIVGEDSATALQHNQEKKNTLRQSASFAAPGNHHGRSVHFVSGVKFSLDEDEIARKANDAEHCSRQQWSQHQQCHQPSHCMSHAPYQQNFPKSEISISSAVHHHASSNIKCADGVPSNQSLNIPYVPQSNPRENIFMQPAHAQPEPSCHFDHSMMTTPVTPFQNNTLPQNTVNRRPTPSPIRQRGHLISDRNPSWNTHQPHSQQLQQYAYNQDTEMSDVEKSLVPYNGSQSQQELKMQAESNHHRQVGYMSSKAVVEERTNEMEARTEENAQNRGCEAWISHDWNMSICCGNLMHTASHDSHDMAHMEIGSTGSIGGASLCHVFDEERRNSFSDRSMDGTRARAQHLLRINNTRSGEMFQSGWDRGLNMKPSDVGSLGSALSLNHSLKSNNSMTMINETRPVDVSVTIDPEPLPKFSWSYDSRKETE